jgi:two-component system, NarL family, invasion response regulator UvrY
MKTSRTRSKKGASGAARTILIVDDHEIVRDGVARIINAEFGDYEPVAVATYGEAIDAAHSGNLALVIADLSIVGRGGLDLIREISNLNRALPLLVYSMHDEKEFGLRAIRNGAWGYVQKGSTLAEFTGAIRQVLAGQRYVSADLAQSLVSFVRHDSDRPPHERLSTREFQILCRLAKGTSVKDIGSELFLSVKTVSTYRARIFTKLGVKSIAQMVRYAIERGLV